MTTSPNILPLDLKRMAASIAANYGDKGAVVITVGDDGFRIGVSNLTDRELHDALCVGIHHCVLMAGDQDQ